MKMKIAALICSLVIFSSCSVQRIAIRSLGGVLDNSMSALFEEGDLKLAESAIASDLKLLEGLIKSDPGNEHLLFLASQGFTSYALGFVEDTDPERAKSLYLRARDYGMQILSKRREFDASRSGDLGQFKIALEKFEAKDVPALFWTANAWASWINLSFTDPQALADLPRVQMLMERVIALNENYFFGGAHLFFGTIYAARPPILGGDIEKSKYHFDKCFERANHKFLLPYVYFARFYATRQFDQELYIRILDEVIQTPDDILVDQRLPNAIAKQKAKLLLERVEEFF